MFSSFVDASLVSRFLAGGAVNTLVGLTIIFLLMAIGTDPIVANIAGYAVGLLLSFVVNRRFVFRANGAKSRELSRYVVAFLASFLANLTILQFLTRRAYVSPLIAQFVAIAVYAVLMFLLCRVFVFGRPPGFPKRNDASIASQRRAGGPAGPAASTRSQAWKRNLVGIAISCICLGFIARRINLNDVLGALEHFQWPYLLWAFVSLALGYTMRVVRWSTMLRAGGAHVSRTACAAPLIGSIALNNVLPMRLGDVMRALVFPAAIGVGRAAATGSLILERLLDLMTLLACVAIGLAVSSKAHLPPWAATAAVSLSVIGGTTLALVFLFSGWLSRLCDDLARGSFSEGRSGRRRVFTVARDLLRSFDAMSRIPVLAALLGLSMLVWAGEAGLFWAVLLGFGLDAGPAAAVTVMSIATLATLVPSAPGYVGPFHLAAFAAISMLGGTQGQAASFAILSHLAVWLPTTLAGALFILVNPGLFGRARAEAATLRHTTLVP